MAYGRFIGATNSCYTYENSADVLNSKVYIQNTYDKLVSMNHMRSRILEVFSHGKDYIWTEDDVLFELERIMKEAGNVYNW